MQRYFLLFIFCLFTSLAYSGQDNPRIIILPFDIHSKEDISYLSTKIPDVIKKNLKEHQAVIIDNVIFPKQIKDNLELKKLQPSSAFILLEII
ncbi:MAG: hypothetical protein HQK78_17320 [Desulfobacterales bacterium]|nr:hypothetical protein [Desulfobacterales bacterium]